MTSKTLSRLAGHISRTGQTDAPLEVHYRTGGTASNGADDRELVGTVTVPAGAGSAELVLTPIDDKSVERTQSVIFTLLPTVCVPSFPPPKDCYRVGEPDQARAAILDNDVNPANLPPKMALFRPVSVAKFVAGRRLKSGPKPPMPTVGPAWSNFSKAQIRSGQLNSMLPSGRPPIRFQSSGQMRRSASSR